MHALMVALLALMQDKPTVALRAAEVAEWMSKHSDQTRVAFRGDARVLVGVSPGESQLSSLVILARAVPEK